MSVDFSSHTLIHDDGVNGLSGEQFDAIAATFAPEISAILDSCFVKTGAGLEFMDGASEGIAAFLLDSGMPLATAIVATSTGKAPTNILFLLPTLWLVLDRTFPDASSVEIGNAVITRLIQSAGRQSAAVAGGRVQ